MDKREIDRMWDESKAEQKRFREWYSTQSYAHEPCLKDFQIWLAAKQDQNMGVDGD